MYNNAANQRMRESAIRQDGLLRQNEDSARNRRTESWISSIRTRPAGLSGDAYTIYTQAENFIRLNGPQDPNYEMYKMQMENALMQMRSPAYRGRRPEWLEREMAAYPSMPGVIDGPERPPFMPGIIDGQKPSPQRPPISSKYPGNQVVYPMGAEDKYGNQLPPNMALRDDGSVYYVPPKKYYG